MIHSHFCIKATVDLFGILLACVCTPQAESPSEVPCNILQLVCFTIGEADLVAIHVESLVEAGVNSQDIAVISPYNLQVC